MGGGVRRVRGVMGRGDLSRLFVCVFGGPCLAVQGNNVFVLSYSAFGFCNVSLRHLSLFTFHWFHVCVCVCVFFSPMEFLTSVVSSPGRYPTSVSSSFDGW